MGKTLFCVFLIFCLICDFKSTTHKNDSMKMKRARDFNVLRLSNAFVPKQWVHAIQISSVRCKPVTSVEAAVHALSMRLSYHLHKYSQTFGAAQPLPTVWDNFVVILYLFVSTGIYFLGDVAQWLESGNSNPDNPGFDPLVGAG